MIEDIYLQKLYSRTQACELHLFPLTNGYDLTTERWMLDRAVATLERDGIAWGMVMEDRGLCLWRSL